MEQSIFQAALERFFDKMTTMARSKVAIGDPIVVGETTLIPITQLKFGLGGGGSEGQGPGDKKHREKGFKRGSGHGGGMGGGIGIEPMAVICIDASGARVLPIPAQKKGLERLLDRVPELFERLQNLKDQKHPKEAKDADCCAGLGEK